jgi:hypothetical protein
MNTLHLSHDEMLDVLTFFTVRAALEAIEPRPANERTLWPVADGQEVALAPAPGRIEGH